MNHTATFDVKSADTLGGDVYRVFLLSQNLIFIDLGGAQAAKGISQGMEFLMGPLGIIGTLIRLVLKRRAINKTEESLQQSGCDDPEVLLREKEGSFEISIHEIRSSSIEPPTSLSLSAAQTGYWKLILRDGRKYNFGFESVEGMRAALNLLPPVMSDTLQVKAEWDEAGGRFQKKK